MKKLWQCPNCNREFAKINQMHSCHKFPIENHFKNKLYAKELFNKLVEIIKDRVGPIKIESLSCCIHFVGSYTFGAAWAKKDGLMIDFRVSKEIKSSRIFKSLQMSTNRFLYHVLINKIEDIDSELLEWLKESYALNQ